MREVNIKLAMSEKQLKILSTTVKYFVEKAISIIKYSTVTRSLELKKNYKVRFRIIFSNLGNKIYNCASKLKYE